MYVNILVLSLLREVYATPSTHIPTSYQLDNDALLGEAVMLLNLIKYETAAGYWFTVFV